MSPLNEYIVEDAALIWVGEQTRGVRTLTPAIFHKERENDCELVLVGRLRDAIRRLNFSIPKQLSGVLTVGSITPNLEAIK